MDFKIGNIVKLINPGQIYSSYVDMAKILEADIDGAWVERSVDEGEAVLNEIGSILNIHAKYLLIQLFDNGDQWVVSPLAIKKMDVGFLPDGLFEV